MVCGKYSISNKAQTIAAQKGLKAPNGIQWEVAHWLTLNYEAPIQLLLLGMQPYVSAVKSLHTYVWSAFTTDTYGCVHRNDRGSII